MEWNKTMLWITILQWKNLQTCPMMKTKISEMDSVVYALLCSSLVMGEGKDSFCSLEWLLCWCLYDCIFFLIWVESCIAESWRWCRLVFCRLAELLWKVKLLLCSVTDKYATVLNDRSPGILLFKTKLRKTLSFLAQNLNFRKQLFLARLVWIWDFFFYFCLFLLLLLIEHQMCMN